MKQILSFYLLFISTLSVAQFNYQALIKDSNGNTMTNNQVKFKFTLMENSSTSSPVYVEEHTVITPQSGVVNLSIGAGDVSSGSFSAIDWSNEVYIKEELDIGGGYEDMGTRQFASVPIAEYAKSAESSISSLTFVDSSNNLAIGTSVSLDGERNVAIGIGALADENSNAKYNVGIGYASLSNITSGTGNIAIGDSSLNVLDNGNNNLAIGDTALLNNISNDNIAIGTKSLSRNASGTANIAVGNTSLYHNIYGSRSIGIGHGALAGNYSYGNNIAIGIEAMYSSSNISSNTGSYNVAIGNYALYENSTGQANTAIGHNSLLKNSTGTENIAIGNSTLNENETGYGNIAVGHGLRSNISGSLNIAIGIGTLNNNTSADNNIALGYYALSSNVSSTYNLAIGNGSLSQNIADRNLAVGASSLEYNRLGTVNTAIGFQAMQFNQTGSSNTAFGDSSLYHNVDGDFNVAIGRSSILNNETGDMNVGVGDSALYENLGSKNTALGTQAGQFLNTENSSENTFIGYYADTVSGTVIYNSTAIGARAVVTTSNTIQLGDPWIEKVKTSGIVNASGFMIDGVSVATVEDTDQILDIFDELETNLFENTFYDYKSQTVWMKILNEQEYSGSTTSPNTFLTMDFIGENFIQFITDNICDDLPVPGGTYLTDLNEKITIVVNETTYDISTVQFSPRNITIKYSSLDDFDDDGDGVGWAKLSFTLLNQELMRLDIYYSDGYQYSSNTYRRLDDPGSSVSLGGNVFNFYNNICN